MSESPSYHDLHITTVDIKRKSIFNLPFAIEITCTRSGGWQLWDKRSANIYNHACIAGEYEGEDKWIILDVGGCIICNSKDKHREE